MYVNVWVLLLMALTMNPGYMAWYPDADAADAVVRTPPPPPPPSACRAVASSASRGLEAVHACVRVCACACMCVCDLLWPRRPPTSLPPPRPRLLPQYISVLTGQTSSVAVQQVIQLGMFSIITYAVEMLLEYGFMKMAANIVMQIIQGGLEGGARRGRVILRAGEGRGGRMGRRWRRRRGRVRTAS